ncbi:transglutaminaseTgpA domain-containing protein [Tessaracoccus sp. OH4464_COT-324]|uniref:transglutaminase TgpA family protein n=1 Tax=Tessaracoccus sp. OH4464_COT-324 TaxID=2491059 RepID=UPI00131A2DEC|nr:transglutaminaseTgpA domain-containing protein [Tessaracoccus sp. OH4464_COT-324]
MTETRPGTWASPILAVGTAVGLLPLADFFSGRFGLSLFLPSLGLALAAVFLSFFRLFRNRWIFLLETLAALGIVVFLGATQLPGDDYLSAWLTGVQSGLDQISRNTTPITVTPAVGFLALVGSLVLYLFAEFLSRVLGQTVWSFAPLLLGAVVASLVNEESLWLSAYGLPLAAYVVALYCSSGLPSFPSGLRNRNDIRSMLGALGALLILLATLLPATLFAKVLPVNDHPPFQGDSPSSIQLGDPTINLTENLKRPQEQRVLTYSSSTGEPIYLRTVALPDLTNDGARLIPMQLRNFGLAGAYDFPGEEVEVNVQMDFDSDYLPVPFAVDSFSAEGKWSFDPITLSVIASGVEGSKQGRNLNYTAHSHVPRVSPEQLRTAVAGTDVEQITTVAPQMSPEVKALASSVVEGAVSDGDKALRIESFLREDGFRYTFDAPDSTSLDAISSFLLEDRAGYCIHFSSAMVAMARLEGIPARMAVGFNGGTRKPDGSFLVTTHNMHAWPELYFDGLGWVPFEPTPGDGGFAPPASNPSDAPNTTDPVPTPSSPASPSPSAQPSTAPASPAPASQPTTAKTEQAAWLGILLWLLLGLAVTTVLSALPSAVRTGQRRWRLRPAQPPSEAARNAWQEVVATLADIGISLPAGSPGPAARELGEHLPGYDTLMAIADIVERSFFARDSVDTERLPQLVRLFRSEVLHDAPARYLWLPRSLWRSRSSS